MCRHLFIVFEERTEHQQPNEKLRLSPSHRHGVGVWAWVQMVTITRDVTDIGVVRKNTGTVTVCSSSSVLGM